MTEIYFYSTKSPFSNFYKVKPDGFVHEGVSLPTAEHHLMYQKSLLMGDQNSANNIMEAKRALQAKRLGRKVRPWNQGIWEANREDIMTNILVSKFKHPSMLTHLKATGNAILYEASPSDKIWGIGVSVKSAEVGAPHNGRNLLGKCLMRAREILNNNVRVGVMAVS